MVQTKKINLKMSQIRLATPIKSIDPIVLILLVYIIVAAIFVPNFATLNNFINIFNQSCVLITVAIGVHFAVLNGGVDFSSTSIISLTTIVGASIMSTTEGLLRGEWYAIPVALLAMILTGVIFGIINGLSITNFKMPSFIVTMATQLIGVGIAVVYTGGKPISALPTVFQKIGIAKFGFVPYMFIFTLLLVLIAHILLTHTLYGKRVYAVGTNPKASEIAGIPVKRTILLLYIISGIYAAFAGIIMLAQMGSSSTNYGSNMFNDIMGSIIVGGTSPFGGSGKVINTMFGAILIISISLSLNLLNTPYFIISIIKGLIILIAGYIQIISRTNFKK